MLSRFIFVLMVALTLGTPALAANYQAVSYPTLASNGVAPANIKSYIYKPAGNGPYPAVIVLHGCGGPDQHTEEWGKRLASWGYVAIVPDSFGSRGFGAICTDTAKVGIKVRVHDVIGAAKYLNTLPYVQHMNIGVVSFSHGSQIMMYGVQNFGHLYEFGIKAEVAYYPRCEKDLTHTVIKTPVLMGENDDWTPANLCHAMVQANPTTMTGVFYPDSYHDFDREELTRTHWIQGLAFGKVTSHRLEYNPSAAKDAMLRAHQFLDQNLRAAYATK
jgi:dienelactone hydrolase